MTDLDSDKKLRGPQSQPPRPNQNSYWLIPGKLLAGEYPGDYSEADTRRKIGRYLDAGVTFFLNLTETREPLQSYDKILQEEAAARGLDVEHRRLSITDMHVPPADHMGNILDTIDAAIEAGHTVYVHCWGGIGRTGTVIGCYLGRHGNSGQEALDEIARLWQNVAKRVTFSRSPQTQEQFKYVHNWPEAGDEG